MNNRPGYGKRDRVEPSQVLETAYAPPVRMIKSKPERLQLDTGSITSAFETYLTGAKVFNVKDYGAVGDGITDDTDAFDDAITAAQTAHGTLLVPAATYMVTALPNIAAVDNWSIIGVGGVPTIKHTGAGIAFDCDGSGGTSSRTWNVNVENIAILGNAGTTVGFRFKSLHHCKMRNLRVLAASASGVGFQILWTVLSLYEMLVCTSNENNGSATLPAIGMELDDVGGVQTEGNTFVNCMCEGLANSGDVGLHIKTARRNTFIGGAMESNDTNIVIDSDGQGNKFVGMYCEAAGGTEAWTIAADYTELVHCFTSSAGGPIVVKSGAQVTRFIGGILGPVTVDAGAFETYFIGAAIDSLTDNGTRTSRYGTVDTTSPTRFSDVINNSLSVEGNINYVTDNANDFGGSGASRPRDIYVGRQLIMQCSAPALRANATVANAAVAVTLGSTGPTGATAGAPQGWLPVSINGTTRYMPFW